VFAVAAEGFYQAVFAEFLVTVVHGFGDAIGIKRQQIAATERGFADGALPSCRERWKWTPVDRFIFCSKRCCSGATANWLRRLACKFAVRSAAAISFPAKSAITKPRRSGPRLRKS
jgi:hypothetical protein